MFFSWVVLILGSEIGIRTESLTQLFPFTSANNLRFNCYFATWIVSFLIFWAGMSALFSWYLVMLALILLPLLKILLKHLRRTQIPVRSLAFLDLVLLNMKAGQSFRKSFLVAMESEKSWFTGFQMSLLQGLEAGNSIESESEWFNAWAQEITQIEKSRNKVVEQLEILRRYTRQEQDFKKKIKNATAGPRAQIFVMSLLFTGLNVLAIRNLDSHHIKILLPAAWFLFSLGIAAAIFIMRSFKWKV